MTGKESNPLYASLFKSVQRDRTLLEEAFGSQAREDDAPESCFPADMYTAPLIEYSSSQSFFFFSFFFPSEMTYRNLDVRMDIHTFPCRAQAFIPRTYPSSCKRKSGIPSGTRRALIWGGGGVCRVGYRRGGWRGRYLTKDRKIQETLRLFVGRHK